MGSIKRKRPGRKSGAKQNIKRGQKKSSDGLNIPKQLQKSGISGNKAVIEQFQPEEQLKNILKQSEGLFFLDQSGEDGSGSSAPMSRAQRKLQARKKQTRQQLLICAPQSKQKQNSVPKKGSKAAAQAFAAQQRAALEKAGECSGSRKLINTVNDQTQNASDMEQFDLWDGIAAAAERKVPRGKAERAPCTAPAVQVEQAGCSYNPEYQAHQEALGQAVGALVAKQLDKELQPKAPPSHIEVDPADKMQNMSEMGRLMAQYEIKPDTSDADDDDESEQHTSFNELNASDGDEANTPGVDNTEPERGARGRYLRSQKKTRTERNREARRLADEKIAQDKQQLKSFRKQLAATSDITQKLAELEQFQQERLEIRQADLEHRISTQPPKLSKHQYKELPIQVQLSENVSGSLRKLKSDSKLLRDRYNNILQRGLMEVSVKRQRGVKKKKGYITGDRQDQANAAHQELFELKTKTKQMKKQIKIKNKSRK